MTHEEALKILVQHNAWRRDDGIPNRYRMVNPRELGEAIDIAIVALSSIVGRNIWPEELEEEDDNA